MFSKDPFSELPLVCSTFSSSVFSASSIFEIAAISSPLSSLIKITPCVALPDSFILETEVLKIIPDLHVISKSSFSCTLRMPTRLPVFSVTLMVLTPLPPRFVILYSSIWVRFPKPFSLTTKTVFCVSPFPTHIMPITSSFLSSTSMPETPMAPRPVALTLLSGKRIALPLFIAIIISHSPSVSMASNNSSPSKMVIAFTPVARGRLKSPSSSFFNNAFFGT